MVGLGLARGRVDIDAPKAKRIAAIDVAAPRMRIRARAALASWIAVAACSGRDAQNEPASPALDVVELRAVEELRIDGYEEDLVLIGGMAVGPDGTMVVTQPDDHLVRLYDASGELLRSVGREGEGPGEFRGLSALGWSGDSLVVYDGALERFTILGRDGGLGRTLRASSSVTSGPSVDALGRFVTASEMRLRADGSILARVMGTVQSEAAREHRILFAVMDEHGVVSSVLARIDERRPWIRTSSGSADLRFPNVPRTDIALDGSRVVLAQAAIDGLRAGTFEVTSILSTGDTVFSRRYPFVVREITRSTADSILEADVESMRDRSPGLAAAYRRSARLPPMRPPVLSVLSGRDGTIWIRLYAPEPRRHYLVLERDGEPAARVSLPPRTSLRVAQRDRAWAVLTDELGVQSVVRYRIER